MLQRRRLISLGFAYALAAIVALLAVQAIDGGRFDAALQSVADGTATPETLQDANLAESITAMQQADPARQAAIGVAGGTSKLSLFDFLK